MPEGAQIATEATVPESVEEVRRSIMLRGVAAMSEAKYKLADQGDHSFAFARRYLPRLARSICIVLVVLAVFVQTGNGGEASPALAIGWIAIAVMIFYRRTETLILDLRAAGNGTRITVAGAISKKGRVALGQVSAQLLDGQGVDRGSRL